MDLLISIGAVISVIGLVGIILSILKVRRAKREASDDEDLRAKVQAVLPLNLGVFSVVDCRVDVRRRWRDPRVRSHDSVKAACVFDRLIN